MSGLRPGYKQTEAGLIPEDWDSTTLGQVISLRRGHDLTERQRRPGSVPVFGSAGHNGFHDTAIVSGPGVVLGRSGASYGQAHFCEEDYWPHNTCLYATDYHGNDPKFIYYFLKHYDFSSHNSGGAQQSLNRNFIGPLAVAVPHRIEQQAIAEVLGDADGLIEALQTLIAKKRAIKQGARQDLLSGQRRLPGFQGEWGKARLDTLADIRSGGTPSTSRPDFWDGGVAWCTPTDITALAGSMYLNFTAETISELGLKSSSAEIIPAGSVIMTSRATIGVCVINAIPVATNQGFKNFVPFQCTDVEFLYYALGSRTAEFIALCGGSTFLEIGKKQLRDFMIFVPPTIEEQRAIAAVLSDIDAEIAALEAQLAKARAVKRGMMQVLLTGEVRLT
jgi:type I restriction enzyme S subunit